MKTKITGAEAHEAATVCAHYGCQMMVNMLRDNAMASQPDNASGDMFSSTPRTAKQKSTEEMLKDAMAVASAGSQAYVTARAILLKELKEEATYQAEEGSDTHVDT